MLSAQQPGNLLQASCALVLVCLASAGLAMEPGCDTESWASLRAALVSGAMDSVNGLAISDDGQTVFATHWVEEAQSRRGAIVAYEYRNCGWTLTGPIFPDTSQQDYQPRLGIDGKTLYFTSNRPPNGEGPPVRQNVWFARQNDNGEWEVGGAVPGLVSLNWDGHAMETATGYLYFSSDRPSGQGMVNIYRTRLEGIETGELEQLEPLNSEGSDQDFHIDPAERFIIFSRYDPVRDDLDLFYSVRTNGSWLPARPIDKLNTPEWELSPTVDLGHRVLIFKRGQDPGFEVVAIDQLPQLLQDAVNQQ